VERLGEERKGEKGEKRKVRDERRGGVRRAE
jgi:hypothetical protein